MTRQRAERSDALLHREQLLTAAEAVFHEHGVHASLDLVAKAAGLGKASLYRRFPNRAALLVALLDREVDAVFRYGEGFPESEAVLAMLRYLADAAIRTPALAESWRIIPLDNPDLQLSRNRLIDRLQAPLAAAQAAGLVRHDITANDISLIIRLVAWPVIGADGQPRGKRTLELLFQGILCSQDAT